MKLKYSVAALICMASIANAGGTVVVETPKPVANSVDTMTALKVGTLGVGADISKKITDTTAVRLNVNGLGYSGEETVEGIDYDADLTLFTAGVLLDYYPSLDSSFRVTAGAYYNGNEVSGKATLTAGESITIGDTTYDSSEIGSANMKMDFDAIAPYIGIGWSSYTDSGWSFALDVGIMYHGEANVDLNVDIKDATLANQIRDDVEKEKQEIIDKVHDYKIYPVVMIGATYRF